jgi:hypothetical protein
MTPENLIVVVYGAKSGRNKNKLQTPIVEADMPKQLPTKVSPEIDISNSSPQQRKK